jgi:hypothetical protein
MGCEEGKERRQMEAYLMTQPSTSNEKRWKRVHDFEYRGFNCTVVNYSFETLNLARTFLEGMDDYSDWWCGYVQIPEGHKFYGKYYDDVDIDCHGGLTFAGDFHVTDSNNAGKWCIGFDFQHYNDHGGDRMKAEFECKKVVDQMLEMAFVQ